MFNFLFPGSEPQAIAGFPENHAVALNATKDVPQSKQRRRFLSLKLTSSVLAEEEEADEACPPPPSTPVSRGFSFEPEALDALTRGLAQMECDDAVELRSRPARPLIPSTPTLPPHIQSNPPSPSNLEVARPAPSAFDSGVLPDAPPTVQDESLFSVSRPEEGAFIHSTCSFKLSRSLSVPANFASSLEEEAMADEQAALLLASPPAPPASPVFAAEAGEASAAAAARDFSLPAPTETTWLTRSISLDTTLGNRRKPKRPSQADEEDADFDTIRFSAETADSPRDIKKSRRYVRKRD